MVKALKTIGLWLGVTLLVLLAGVVWVMLEYTLVNPWLFFGCVAVIAAGVTAVCARSGRLVPLWATRHRASGSDTAGIKYTATPLPGGGATGWRRVAGMVVTFLITAVVVSGIALAVNYFTADFNTVTPTKGVITRKYQQTRHRTRRSGRHSYERGEPYQVYKFDIDLSPAPIVANDSHAHSPEAETEASCPKAAAAGTITIETSRSSYAKFHKGDTVTVAIAKGLLRLPVVAPSTLKPHGYPTKAGGRKRKSNNYSRKTGK